MDNMVKPLFVDAAEIARDWGVSKTKAYDIISNTVGIEAAIATFAENIVDMPTIQYELIGNTLMKFVEESKDISDDVKMLADKLSESAEIITHRHKQILEFMKKRCLV